MCGLQAKLLEKGHWQQARDVGVRQQDENDAFAASLRLQQKPYGNRSSANFNILQTHKLEQPEARLQAVLLHLQPAAGLSECACSHRTTLQAATMQSSERTTS